MRIELDAYWVYGYRLSELGEYRYDEWKKASTFWFAGQEYASTFMSTLDLRKLLPQYRYDDPHRVILGRAGSEDMLYCRVEAGFDNLNPVPRPDELLPLHEQLVCALHLLGHEGGVEPTLYFVAEVKDNE